MLRNELSRSEEWSEKVDLFMHRTITEVKKTSDEDGEDVEAEEEVGGDFLNKNATAGGEAGEDDEEEGEEEGEAKDDE